LDKKNRLQFLDVFVAVSCHLMKCYLNIKVVERASRLSFYRCKGCFCAKCEVCVQ